MKNPPTRVSEQTRDRLAALADATSRPMTKVLDDVVDALERRVFFERFNRPFRLLDERGVTHPPSS